MLNWQIILLSKIRIIWKSLAIIQHFILTPCWNDNQKQTISEWWMIIWPVGSNFPMRFSTNKIILHRKPIDKIPTLIPLSMEWFCIGFKLMYIRDASFLSNTQFYHDFESRNSHIKKKSLRKLAGFIKVFEKFDKTLCILAPS